MFSDKERIDNLKEKIRQFEQELEKKNELISQYETIEKSADNKIKALNAINTEKVRSLMNSITILKKKNLTLKKSNKEHKRSELISGLNKEIGDQDLIIETLRKLINNEDLADKEIIKALTKGPPKLRIETREELKIELRKLKAKLTVKNDNKDELNVQNIQNREEINKNNMEDSLISTKTDFNENFFMQLDSLKRENEELKINLKTQEIIQMRYDSEISLKEKEINELRLIKTDFQVLSKKYEILQSQFEEKKDLENQKFILTYDKEMRLQELEILHKTQQGKIDLVANNMNLESENFKSRIEDLENKNNELIGQNEEILMKYNELLKKNSDLSQTIRKNLEENKNIKNERELDKKKYESNIKEMKEIQDKIVDEKNKIENEMININNSIYKYQNEIFQREEEIKLISKENQILMQKINEKNNNIPQIGSQIMNSNNNIPNNMINENKLLKKKIKELTVQQINLKEMMESYELENRLRSKKESHITIKNKLIDKKNGKIDDLAKYLKKLEEENKQLRVLYDRMDSNISITKSEIENINNINLDSNISMSISKVSSELSTPIRDFNDTSSNISIENEELKKILKIKQNHVLDLKIKNDELEKNNEKLLKNEKKKKDLAIIEKDQKINNLAERISEINLSNSDLESKIEKINDKNHSFMDSNFSNTDSNIDIDFKEIRNEYTDSNITMNDKI